MILSDIRGYLADRRQATLPALARHFETDAEALRPMLDLWIAKGCVRLHRPESSCDGCTLCDAGTCEVYEWVDG